MSGAAAARFASAAGVGLAAGLVTGLEAGVTAGALERLLSRNVGVPGRRCPGLQALLSGNNKREGRRAMGDTWREHEELDVVDAGPLRKYPTNAGRQLKPRGCVASVFAPLIVVLSERLDSYGASLKGTCPNHESDGLK
jgi:hypothetical protein